MAPAQPPTLWRCRPRRCWRRFCASATPPLWQGGRRWLGTSPPPPPSSPLPPTRSPSQARQLQSQSPGSQLALCGKAAGMSAPWRWHICGACSASGVPAHLLPPSVWFEGSSCIGLIYLFAPQGFVLWVKPCSAHCRREDDPKGSGRRAGGAHSGESGADRARGARPRGGARL